MSFDSRTFRSALGTFATGVTVITTRPPEGEPLPLSPSLDRHLRADRFRTV